MTKTEQELIHAELARIAEENSGRLTPDAVVAAAKSKDNPLHAQFEWDGKLAAHAWRIEQARSLIRSVRIVVKTERTNVSTVCYVRDPDAGSEEQGYVTTVSLIGDTERARETLVREFSMAAGSLRRARELAAVFEMAGEVEAVVEAVEHMTARVMTSAKQPAQAAGA